MLHEDLYDCFARLIRTKQDEITKLDMELEFLQREEQQLKYNKEHGICVMHPLQRNNEEGDTGDSNSDTSDGDGAIEEIANQTIIRKRVNSSKRVEFSRKRKRDKSATDSDIDRAMRSNNANNQKEIMFSHDKYENNSSNSKDNNRSTNSTTNTNNASSRSKQPNVAFRINRPKLRPFRNDKYTAIPVCSCSGSLSDNENCSNGAAQNSDHITSDSDNHHNSNNRSNDNNSIHHRATYNNDETRLPRRFHVAANNRNASRVSPRMNIDNAHITTIAPNTSKSNSINSSNSSSIHIPRLATLVPANSKPKRNLGAILDARDYV